MKRGTGKQKGSAFERDICKQLSLWISGGKSIDLLWRSAMSGGRATIAKGKVRQAGDITAVAPEGHVLTNRFVIETKHLKDIGLSSVIKETATFKVIWKQVCDAVKDSEKEPLCILKQNFWPIVVCSTRFGIIQLKALDHVKLIVDQIHIALFDDVIKTPLVTDEIWVPVPGAENNYLASSCGRIQNISIHRRKDNGILKPSLGGDGYLQVNIGGRVSLLHRIICGAFHGSPKEYQECNHKNGIKDDCRPQNLEWVTRSENQLHRYNVLLTPSTKGRSWGKHTPEAIEKMKAIAKAKFGVAFGGFIVGQSVILSEEGLAARKCAERYLENKNWEETVGILAGFTKDGKNVKVVWEGNKSVSNPFPIEHIQHASSSCI